MMRVEPRLRPRTFGGILDAAFESLRYDLATLLGISLLVNAPLAVAVLLLLFGATLLGGAFAAALLPLAVLAALFFLLRPLAHAAVIAALEERTEHGRPPAIGRAYARAGRAALAVVFADMATCALAALTGIFYLLPGVLIAGWFILAVPAAAIEGKGPFEALGRSTKLLKGRLGRGVGAVAFLVVVAGIMTANVLGAVSGGLAVGRELFGLETAYWETFLTVQNGLYVAVVLVAVYLALEPYRACLVYHLHLDSRVRYEASDLIRELDRVIGEAEERKAAARATVGAAS